MAQVSQKAIDGWIHRYLAGYSTVELGVPTLMVSDAIGATVRLESKHDPVPLYEATWAATPTPRKIREVSLQKYRLHRTTGEWVECRAAYDFEYGLLLSPIETIPVDIATKP